MTRLNFKEKQFDGPYEVIEVQINNDGERFRGILYFPPKLYKTPYPLIIYFHGFPQLHTLREIIHHYCYLLDLGYSFFVFNFRGYSFSEGKVSITSQISDALKVIDFIQILSRKGTFNSNSINIIGNDIGGFVALNLCSKIDLIKDLLLISPILNLKKHIYNPDVFRTLNYINHFLPGYIHGIENVNEFINLIKQEIEKEEFDIKNIIKNLHCKRFKIIIGDNDKITPISEINNLIRNLKNVKYETCIIKEMNHEYILDEEAENVHNEILKFFN